MRRESSGVWVLDSYALFVLLQLEPGFERVKELLHEAGKGRAEVWMSLINLGEMAYMIERRHGRTRLEEFLVYLEVSPIRLAEVTYERILRAAHIKAGYRVSYADAFAISLAEELGAIVLTGDPQFKEVERIVPVEWLPNSRSQ
jgi:ribonuclease VapC